jgi:drug/metabolite transporter (DMT)-like permease
MSVPAAFAGVVLIWATTPLAIKWSSEGAGYLFGVASRMLLGALVCLSLVSLLGRRLPRSRGALLTYLAAGLGLWGAMTSVYWSVQFIASGLISVLFGLSPLVTGLMAALWLGERALTPARLGGLGLGLAGLAIVFAQALRESEGTGLGIAAVLLSVLIHSASAVWIKRIGAGVPALETTTGALLVALPLFLLGWVMQDGQFPAHLDPRTLWSILYLAVCGSALGFILYYYVLHRVEASRVALITFVTPVIALFLGRFLNGEVIGPKELVGTTAILAGLACHQWGERWLAPPVESRD